MNWTPAQEAAITAKPCTLLISAAAGSGKTAVLTERIVEKIADPENELTVENVAVVTFTKAAAGELKERLYKKLSLAASREGKNRRLTTQLMALPSARISTIHSFCFSILRENTAALNLSPAVSIADPVRASALLNEAVKKTVRAYYAKEKSLPPHDPADFTYLLELCGVSGDDGALIKLLTDLYLDLRSYPAPMTLIPRARQKLEQELKACENGELSPYAFSFFLPLAKSMQLLALAAAKKYHKLREICLSVPSFSKKSLEILEDEWETAVRCSQCAPEDLPAAIASKEKKGNFNLPKTDLTPEQADRIRAMRKEAKKDLDTLAEQCKEFTPDSMVAHLKKGIALTKLSEGLLTVLDREYSSLKEDASLLDYADLEQNCAALLCENVHYTTEGVDFTPSPLAKNIAESICELYVDEYQDTNLLQDMIFRAVTRPGRTFMVGDPKQSVYGFRGARPEIFARYKSRFPDYSAEKSATEQKLMLSNNFRCDRSVIDLTNRIFSLLMNTDKDAPLYTEADRLIFTKNSDSALPAELLLTDKADDAEEEADESSFDDPEAANVRNRIHALMKEGLLTENGAALSYGDIAILARDSKILARMRRTLIQSGIPCTQSVDDTFLTSAEVLFISSLIQLIDNPHNDVAMAAVMNSPVFAFTPDELLEIRSRFPEGSYYAAARESAKENEKLSAFFSLLERLREYASEHSLCDLMLYCLDETDAENVYAACTESQRVRENVRSLLDLAAECDRVCDGDPATLLEWINGQGKKSANTEDASENAVHLMTIHHSKGLEYPVVIAVGLEKKFNLNDLRANCLFDPDGGLSFRVFDASGAAKIRTASFAAAALKKKQELAEEEKRLLYVAMTRARQKLILSGSVAPLALVKKLYPTACAEEENGELLAQTASSLLDLSLAGLCGDGLLFETLNDYLSAPAAPLWRENGTWRIGIVPASAALKECFEPLPLPVEEERPMAKAALNEDWCEAELRELLDFEYPFATLSQIPKKLSVSGLSPVTEVTREPPVPLAPGELFGQSKSDAAFAGTAAHQFMQFCDFSLAERDCEKEADRLRDLGFLSPEQRDVLRLDKLAGFFLSPLYAALKKSKRVHRELRFNVFLPASSLIETDDPREVLLQGVIDCFFENPDGSFTLLDFKTDRAFGEEGRALLRERHSRQLRIYRLAVEKMTEAKVSHLYLWSFSLGEAVDVTIE